MLDAGCWMVTAGLFEIEFGIKLLKASESVFGELGQIIIVNVAIASEVSTSACVHEQSPVVKGRYNQFPASAGRRQQRLLCQHHHPG